MVRRGAAQLHILGILGKVLKVAKCNLLEDEIDELEVLQADNGAFVELKYSPWQILSLKIWFDIPFSLLSA